MVYGNDLRLLQRRCGGGRLKERSLSGIISLLDNHRCDRLKRLLLLLLLLLMMMHLLCTEQTRMSRIRRIADNRTNRLEGDRFRCELKTPFRNEHFGLVLVTGVDAVD